MRYFIESLDNCCTPPGTAASSSSSQDTTFIQKIFGGRLRSQVRFKPLRFPALAILGTLWHIHTLLFLTLIFCVTPYNCNLQGKLIFIQNGLVSKKLCHFFSRKLNLSLYFDLELSHVALSPILPLSQVLPCSSLHLVIFRGTLY
jgi:hypothetical protein